MTKFLSWEGPNWDAISAQALGLDEDGLFAELDAGKTIAQIAQERGVDVQTIADALIAADTEYINKLVAGLECKACLAVIKLALSTNSIIAKQALHSTFTFIATSHPNNKTTKTPKEKSLLALYQQALCKKSVVGN